MIFLWFLFGSISLQCSFITENVFFYSPLAKNIVIPEVFVFLWAFLCLQQTAAASHPLLTLTLFTCIMSEKWVNVLQCQKTELMDDTESVSLDWFAARGGAAWLLALTRCLCESLLLSAPLPSLSGFSLILTDVVNWFFFPTVEQQSVCGRPLFGRAASKSSRILSEWLR